MSYRDEGDSDQSNSKRWYWPQLDTLDEAYSVARKAFGGWIFAGMTVLGLLVTYFSGKSLIDLKTPETQLTSALVGASIELLFVLFASYRMVTGRGWIISWLLLALFAAECLGKIFYGGHSVGWIFFYLAVGASILGGARACWVIHSREKSGETVETQAL